MKNLCFSTLFHSRQLQLFMFLLFSYSSFANPYPEKTGTNALHRFAIADYTISTLGNVIVITDVSGNGETLTVSESAGNIRFDVTGRTFSLDGGAATSFPGDVALGGKTGIVINTANGNDIINIGAFTTNNLPSLTIHGGTGDDAVNFNGNISFATDANLEADLQNDDATPGIDAFTIAANANVRLFGTGTATVKVSKNVTVNAGGRLETVNGDLLVEANQQTTPTAGNFNGVRITGTSGLIQSTGNGSVTIKGKGGDDAASGSQHGVAVSGGGRINGRTVSVTGNGGASEEDRNFGVFVINPNSLITSSGGNVSVTGTGGGTSTSSSNYGVFLSFGGQITAGSTGTVTVIGNGGTSSGNINIGVYVFNTNALITSSGGNVSVTGSGGTGSLDTNIGVFLDTGGQITAGGTGTVTVTGNGGPASGSTNVGVLIRETNTTITSSGGNVSVTGKEGGGSTGYGISIQNSGAITTAVNGGNISLTANSMNISSGTLISTNAASTLTLHPFTANTSINLGSVNNPIGGPLSLSDAELDLITTGTLVIGDATAGPLTVSANISRPAATNVQLLSAGDVTLSGGGFNTNGGTLLLDPGNPSAAVKPTFTGTDVTASILSFGSDLALVINGTTPGTQYDQLKVVGEVDLTGVSLKLSGTPSPALVGGETFTLIDNDGTEAITGTFTGLLQGATIPNFLGSGRNATISYTAGSGNNDAVITVASSDLTLTKATSSSFIQGGTATYTLTVNNIGAESSSGIYTITDPMPSGLSIQSIVTNNTWNCTTTTATQVNCVSSTAIPSGSSAGAVQVFVAITANAPANITNTASVSGGGEVTTNNNSGSVTSSVASAIVLTCPTNTTAAVCQTQAAVNSAFSTWLSTAGGIGGCNGILTNNNTGAPLACGGSTTVIFTYTSSCGTPITTCQATFTVPAPPMVVLTCPVNTTTAACQTQAAVNSAFNTWLATASTGGGCNGVLTNDNTGAPLACGGSTTVTFTYTSSCSPTTTTCQATFTVPAAPTVVLTCPVNTTAGLGQTQAAVNSAFASWLATASVSGGCNGVLTNNNSGAPSACGGSTTVTFTYTSSCSPATTTCQATFIVPSVSISGSATVCQNSPTPVVTFTANGGTPPYTFTYQINGGANQSVNTMGNSVSVSHSTATPGTFVYTLLVDSQCNQNNTVTIHVLTKPTISLSVQNQVLNEGNNPVFCDNDANPANPLQFNLITGCVTGNPVWRIQIGSGAWSDWSSAVPGSQPSNNTAYRYQAACDANCPNTYTNPISVTINYRASTPQNVSLVADGTTVNAGESKTICNLEGNTLTFNATCAAGEIGVYSVDGGDYNSLLPSQIVDNTFHNYRVRCRKADNTPSCIETESAVMSLKITTSGPAPTVSITPLNGCGTPTAFSGSSNCGVLTTIWYNATTNQALPTLPTTTPNATSSFYARCQNTASAGEAGCLSEPSNTVTFTITPVNDPPTITASADMVCTGTQVTITASCPAGSTAFWNTGVSTNSFQVAFNNVTQQTYWAKCIFPNGCQSPESVHKTILWKAFDLTFINIGQSQSGIKPANDRNLWVGQFITKDGGPVLENSTQANPTIYYSENVNKTAPRFWTIQVETCALGTDGSVTYDLLAAPEVGVVRSYNTHENNAPYLMYANREGFTELYAQNHPAYGFYQDNGSGGNTYDAGLPKGLYKLSVRYWDQKGQGSIYPSTRQPAGNVLAYQEYWFRIQSKNGIGTGAARLATDNVDFAQVMPNPVSNTLHLKLNGANDQKVNVNLVDASGRTLLQRAFVPETNQHQEEFEVSHLSNGMYFIEVKTADKNTTLKVIKM